MFVVKCLLLKNECCQNSHKELRFRCYNCSRRQHKIHVTTRSPIDYSNVSEKMRHNYK